MKRIRTALLRNSDSSLQDEAGLTLIEVLVAMMIFAIVTLGLAYSVVNALVITRDTRSREIAANLASQEIDLDRANSNVFALVGTSSWTKAVNGTIFTVTRSADWVSTNNATVACGAGGGTLQYVRDNISVTWTGQSVDTPAVASDTLIAPNNRINDPTLGTIIVTVTAASGAGTPGATVTVTPDATPNGAIALTTLPAATDSNGCSWALKVTPGNYDVSVSETGYLDINQKAAPVDAPVQVAAGAVATAPFTYDKGALYTLKYASNVTTTTPVLPSNLSTTFISTLAPTYTTKLGSATSLSLFPLTAGYAAIAGAYVPVVGTSPSCLNVDPAAWTTVASDGAVGVAPPMVTSPESIVMGSVKITGLTSGKYLTAVSQATGPAGTGDPGCGIATTYTFPVLTSTSSTIALPFGSWKIYTGTTSGSTTTAIATTAMSLLTRGTLTATGAIVTFDPRVVLP